MKINEEYVVLVDEVDRQIGIEKKEFVHGLKTPLHRAFSFFLFRDLNTRDLLLQQRAKAKKTWPLVWSNSCCGHPLPNETYEMAVKRRVEFELGVTLDRVVKISNYRYCFSKDGVMENEICPVFAGFYDGKVIPNPEEVEAVKWIRWENWLEETILYPEKYSPWCIEETQILALDERFDWALGLAA
ncbi:MAG: isopentenyl-diphosphate Delta-isomerase [Desulfobacteraceae bacterium]|nr:isopentenyl-diphosphate Delta-isomerase [Desulfobacteraceae bacterium]